MAEIVNLRRARKAKTRGERETTATANRILHGAPKLSRKTAGANREKAAHALELHKIERNDKD